LRDDKLAKVLLSSSGTVKTSPLLIQPAWNLSVFAMF